MGRQNSKPTKLTSHIQNFIPSAPYDIPRNCKLTSPTSNTECTGPANNTAENQSPSAELCRIVKFIIEIFALAGENCFALHARSISSGHGPRVILQRKSCHLNGRGARFVGRVTIIIIIRRWLDVHFVKMRAEYARSVLRLNFAF